MLNLLRKLWYSQTYSTAHHVIINDWRIGLLYNVLLIGIVWYVVFYQVLYEKVHLKTRTIEGVAYLGISRMSDNVVMTLPPSELNDTCQERVANPVVEVKSPATLTPIRLSSFSLMIEESQSAILLPTLIREKIFNYSCYGRVATKLSSEDKCEEMPSQPTKYTTVLGIKSDDDWDNNYVVLDPTRFVLLVEHAPRFKSADWTAISNDAKKMQTDSAEIKSGTNMTDAEKTCASGMPYRHTQKAIDFIPLSYVLTTLLRATVDCKNNMLEYLPLLNGFTILLSIRYYNKPLPDKDEWSTSDILGDTRLRYTLSASLVSNRSFVYKHDHHFDNVGRVRKIHGIRVQVEAHGDLHEFYPMWITSSFLPQLLALITVATSAVRFLLLNGDKLLILRRVFCLCDVFRARSFPLCGPLGARSIWYKSYLKYQTPNLAAIDYYLRCVTDPSENDGEVVTDHFPRPISFPLPPYELHKWLVEKSVVSAFNDENDVVYNDLTREQLNTQLRRLYWWIQQQAHLDESKKDDLAAKLCRSPEMKVILMDHTVDKEESSDEEDEGVSASGATKNFVIPDIFA